MRISFPDAGMQRVFNEYARLEARFGPQLAVRIATRLQLLAAARHLGVVPRRRPIGLRAAPSGSGFTVDLTLDRRLRFTARNGPAPGHGDVDETRIEEIEVAGVE